LIVIGLGDATPNAVFMVKVVEVEPAGITAVGAGVASVEVEDN